MKDKTKGLIDEAAKQLGGETTVIVTSQWDWDFQIKDKRQSYKLLSLWELNEFAVILAVKKYRSKWFMVRRNGRYSVVLIVFALITEKFTVYPLIV